MQILSKSIKNKVYGYLKISNKAVKGAAIVVSL